MCVQKLIGRIYIEVFFHMQSESITAFVRGSTPTEWCLWREGSSFTSI